MASLRFLTVRDLFEAFPMAQTDVGIEPNDEASLEFLSAQVKEEAWETAVSYCAYLLPRREAVWWGCQSLRRMRPHNAPIDAAALGAAEAWAKEPEEPRRRAALDLGSNGDTRSPATWMALAAGWSGGSIVPEYGMVAPAPDQTARAIRAGLMIAMARVPNDETSKLLKPCIESGINLAAGHSTTSR